MELQMKSFNIFLFFIMINSNDLQTRQAPECLWKELKADNQQFSKNSRYKKKRHRFVAQQNPSCIVLTCSDSRVPAELIFQKDIGELFTVRVAGNIADDVVVDSIEFAARNFDVSLIIVMGHTNCGAVIGAINRLKENKGKIAPQKGHLDAVLNPIEKAIVSNDIEISSKDAIQQSTHANVHAVAEHLIDDSPIIKKAIAEKKLIVVGAEYNLETGLVQELFVIDT
jgi:carbonic anhydrase